MQLVLRIIPATDLSVYIYATSVFLVWPLHKSESLVRCRHLAYCVNKLLGGIRLPVEFQSCLVLFRVFRNSVHFSVFSAFCYGVFPNRVVKCPDIMVLFTVNALGVG